VSDAPVEQALLDASITAERDETKYLLAPARAAALQAELAQRLPVHRYKGERSNALSGAQHFVTTLYFDTPSHAHLRAALDDPEHNVKLRAKEYYDLHPSLAELATSLAQIVRDQPWLWLELKRREGQRTHKRRARLAKTDAARLFAAGGAMTGAGAFAANSDDEHEIAAYCAGLGEPLRVSCLVSYRRASFQDGSGELRVTLDTELAYFAEPEGLWSSGAPLVRTRLGTPRGRESRAVLEVKARAGVPGWLNDALARAGAESVIFSKFVAAATVVHGLR
jgi:hypothetical protein